MKKNDLFSIIEHVSYEQYENVYLIHASMIVMNINKISYMKPLLVVEMILQQT